MCSLLGRLCCLRTHHDRRRSARLQTWESHKRLIQEYYTIIVLHKARVYARLCFVTLLSVRCNEYIRRNDF